MLTAGSEAASPATVSERGALLYGDACSMNWNLSARPGMVSPVRVRPPNPPLTFVFVLSSSSSSSSSIFGGAVERAPSSSSTGASTKIWIPERNGT